MIRAREAPVEPQSEAHFQRATPSGRERQQKTHRAHEVRLAAQQALALAQRFPHQRQLAMLQVAQTAVNDSSGSAGGAGSEVALLDQERTAAAGGALARDRHAVDSAADDGDIETLAVQRTARI